MNDKCTSDNKQKLIKTAGIYTTYRLHYLADNPPQRTMGIQNGNDSGNPARMDIYNGNIYRCLFYTYDELPREEIEILIHITLESKVGFGHEYLAGRNYAPSDYDCISRHYIAEFFLFPAMDKPYDKNSIISRIVHDKTIHKWLSVIKDAMENQSGPYYYRHNKIGGLYNTLFAIIGDTEPIKNLTVYNTQDTKENESWVRNNADCEFLNLSGVPGNIQYPHTTDIVYMKHDDNITFHFTEQYKGRYLAQRKQIYSDDNIVFRKASVYNFISYVIKLIIILASTYPLKLLYSTVLTPSVGNFVWGMMTLVSLTMNDSSVIFEKDKMSYVKHSFIWQRTSRTCSRGMWSYCKIVEYGTFRHFGTKYIYFSKTHMTDDEFSKFRRKIIPYDRFSIALPYKKDFLHLAENLIFVERKDR